MNRDCFGTRWTIGIAVICGALLTLAGCGGGGSDGGGGTQYVFRDGGGVSTVALGTSSYVNNKDNGFKETGSVSREANGFLVITKETTTDPGDPDLGSLPKTFYGLEFPNVALFVINPASEIGGSQGEYTETIVGLNEQGSCPADGTEYLGVATTDEAWDSQNDQAYGTATYNSSTTQLNVSSRKLDETFVATFDTADTLNNMTCSGGVATGTEGTVTFTKGGMGVYELTGGGGFVLLPTDSTLADNNSIWAQSHAVGRRYLGIIQRPYDSEPDGTFEVMSTSFVTTSGAYDSTSMKGAPYSNVDSNEVNFSEEGTLTASPAGSTLGIMDNGDVNFDSARFITTRVDGRFMIFGLIRTDVTGNGPLTEAEDFQTIFLIEEDVDYTSYPQTFSGTERNYVFDDGGSQSDVTFDPDGGVYYVEDTGNFREWGTIVDNGNGFYKLTRQHSMEVGAYSGKEIAVLEIPDLLLQAFDEDDNGLQTADTGLVYSSATADTCLGVSSSQDYALIAVPDESNLTLATADGGDAEIYGEGTLSSDGSNVYTLAPANTKLIANGGTFTAGNLTSGACSGTTVGFSTNSIFLLNQNVAFMEDPTAGAADFLMFPQPSVDITPRTTSVNYVGWAASSVCTDSPTCSTYQLETSPLWATGQGSGNLQGGPFTSVLANTKNLAEAGTLSLQTSASTTGIFPSGTVDLGAGSIPFPFMLMEDAAGKHFLYGVFYDASASESSNWTQIFLYER